MPAKSKRADGRYQVSVSLGRDENGKRLQKCFYGKTQREANAKKSLFLKECEAGIDPDKSKLAVGAWADEWLTVYAPGGFSAMSAHSANVKRLKAAMGDMLLKEIRNVDMQKFANSCTEYCKSHVTKIRSDTQRIFSTAVANQIISASPCVGVKWNSVTDGSHRALEEWEINLIRSNWTACNAGVWAILILYAGLRPGEALGLKWGERRPRHIAHRSFPAL